MFDEKTIKALEHLYRLWQRDAEIEPLCGTVTVRPGDLRNLLDEYYIKRDEVKSQDATIETVEHVCQGTCDCEPGIETSCISCQVIGRLIQGKARKKLCREKILRGSGAKAANGAAPRSDSDKLKEIKEWAETSIGMVEGPEDYGYDRAQNDVSNILSD
jgi:hypothetical protein